MSELPPGVFATFDFAAYLIGQRSDVYNKWLFQADGWDKGNFQLRSAFLHDQA